MVWQALTVAEVRPSRCPFQLWLPLEARAATVLAATASARMASAAPNMDGVEPPVLIVVVAPPAPAPAPVSSGSGGCSPGWKPAGWTYYLSYTPCCRNSPNYDPNADRTECDVYSACSYTGQFAYIGYKSPDWR
jgi:hypothetical protein